VTPAGFHQAITFDPAEWREQAACRSMGPGFFYVDRGEMLTAAKAICAACPSREPCLEYALANNERFGLWGGLSERERRRLRRDRGLRAPERRVACSKGHEYTDESTYYVTPGGYRRCRTCYPSRPAAPVKIDRRRLPDACPQGHPYPDSLAARADRRVVCRVCNTAYKRQWDARRRAELKAELEAVRARRRREAS
jgi:WhiB family transcriptional regulator, redox-sensing transcriptional regulator